METGMVRKVSDKQLSEFIAGACGASQLTFEPVRQGLANSVFRASSGGQSWAVKLLGPATFSAVNYTVVAKLQQQLAVCGLAPVVTAYDPALRVWIEEWVDTPEQQSVDIERLAHSLANGSTCSLVRSSFLGKLLWVSKMYFSVFCFLGPGIFGGSTSVLVSCFNTFRFCC